MSDNSYKSRCLADVEPTPIEWLWPGRLARGKLNAIAGTQGLGKSQFAIYLASVVSRGGSWADGSECPLGSVIFIGCEDDAADTIRPRLDAAEADARRVHILDHVTEDHNGEERLRMFDVGRDIGSLRALADKIGDVALIIIDPISAYSGSADSHKNADVRAALAPLQAMAAEIDACVLLITHLNKGGGDGSAINRVSGSTAYTAVPRSAWLVAEHPDDKKRRIWTPLKNNIGNDQEGFTFTIENVVLTNGIGTSRVELDPTPVLMSAQQAMEQIGETRNEGSKLDDAIQFINAELRDGPVAVKQIKDAAKDAGLSWRTIEAAKSRTGAVATKSGFDGGWVWGFPDPEPDAEDREGREDRKAAGKGVDGGLGEPSDQGRNEDTSQKLCGLRGLREDLAAFDGSEIEEGRV